MDNIVEGFCKHSLVMELLVLTFCNETICYVDKKNLPFCEKFICRLECNYHKMHADSYLIIGNLYWVRLILNLY